MGREGIFLPRREEEDVAVGSIPLDPADRLVYTVSEAGEVLGISRAFAYEFVARGELPVIRLGRRRLVPKVGLLALVDAERFGHETSRAR
jgi:excisionase family DNA binding protein